MEYILIVLMTLSSCVDSSPFDAFTSAIDSLNDINENEPWKNPYLPKTIIPDCYELFLFPNFYFNESVFKGNITIYFKVQNTTNTIIVHKKKLNITSTTITRCDHEDVTVNRTFEYEQNDYWVVQTATPLRNSTCVVKLKMVFHGSLSLLREHRPAFTSGFYKSTYVNDMTGKQSWLLMTEFQPSKSRFAFPNFDEPQFKVNIKVVLRHWKNFTALSNMKELRHVDRDSIWRDTYFKKSPKMSSYLTSFIISDFTSKNNTLLSGKMHRVWARPDRLDKVDYALNVTPAIENYLYKELRLPYRLDKLDQFAVPHLPSGTALENWGLIVNRESTILFDVTKDGDIAREKALALIAHELSHNYFGNAVTCRFWPHVWLNEGLATFYEVRAVHAVDPTLVYKKHHFAELLEATMDTDATITAQPLVPVSVSPLDGYDYFGTMRYYKGAAILRMVESFLGADTFRRGIRRYLKDNENKTVVTDHLWMALEQTNGSSSNLKTIMKAWVYASGYPVITVTCISGNQIRATQKRFLFDPLAVIDKKLKWHVPLTYRTKRGYSDLIWMNKTDVTFNHTLNSSDDWIEFNVNGSGYYRVNYDAVCWNRIANQLKDNHTVFSEQSRSKLLGDALNLAKADQLGYVTFLDLTRYASRERQLTPWHHIHSCFSEINKMIYGTANFSRFQRYFLKLTSSLMDKLQVKDEGSFLEKMLRPKIMSLACSAGHRGCIENTTRLFKAWIQNDTMNPIPANFRKDVCCIGIANSILESEWDTVFERYMMEKSEAEKKELLDVLICARNVTILEKLVEYSMDATRIDIFHGYNIITEIASNPASEDCIWRRLKLNNTSVDKDLSAFYFTVMVGSAVKHVKTREQRQEVIDFLSDKVPVEKKEKLLAKIDKNIRRMDKNFATIVNWLEQNVPGQSE